MSPEDQRWSPDPDPQPRGDRVCVGGGHESHPPWALGVLSGPNGEALVAAFSKPPGLKAGGPGRIKESGQKAPRQFKEERDWG